MSNPEPTPGNQPASSALDAALRFASIGWHVFPCRPAPDKQPLTSHGFHDATTDEAAIVAWWRRWPDAQVGIATGASGLAVVDLDVGAGKDGVAAFSVLEDEHGASGCGLIASTPRSGRHYYYAQPVDSRIGSTTGRDGIDTRGDGGYVIAPSPASPGREWIVGDPIEPNTLAGETDVCAMPEWVREVARGMRRAPERDTPAIAADRRTFVEVASALHAIPPDLTRSTWIKAIYATSAMLDGDARGARLVENWSSMSDVVLADGKRQYRVGEATKIYTRAVVPEGESGELVDRGTLFMLAREFGWRAAGAGADDVAITLVDRPTVTEPAATTDQPAAPRKAGTIEGAPWDEVARMPPIEWQVDGLVPDQSLVVLGGDTEAGKSFLAIDLSFRTYFGVPFIDREVVAGSVIYLAGEGHSGLAARLNAWRRHHRVANENAVEAATARYFVIYDGIPVLSKANMQKGITRLVEQVVGVKGHAPKLIVIDTLSQGLESDENDAKEISPILRGLSDLRKRFACSIVLVHHLAKQGTAARGQRPAAPTKDSIRGSGALTRNVDVVLGLLTRGDSGARELVVWKQKDGRKPDPIGLQMEVVETGRHRRVGMPETSCVFIPKVDDDDLADGSKDGGSKTAQDRAGSTIPDDDAHTPPAVFIERVCANLAALGGDLPPGAGGVAELIRGAGNSSKARAAVRDAIRAGRIVIVNTDRLTGRVPKQPHICTPDVAVKYADAYDERGVARRGARKDSPDIGPNNRSILPPPP